MEEKDNSWYERAELPPVGSSDFEWTLNGQCWEHGLMLFNDGTTCLIANKKYPAIRHHLSSLERDLKFRPLRTEREKFIDAVKRFHNISHVIDADAYFGGLYDAGFRAPEEKCQ